MITSTPQLSVPQQGITRDVDMKFSKLPSALIGKRDRLHVPAIVPRASAHKRGGRALELVMGKWRSNGLTENNFQPNSS
jgi:hypothetical protein